MIEEIFFSGVKHISASDAAELYGFTRDYIGRLCREEKVRGKRVGKNWFVDQESFRVFIVDQEFKKSRSHQALSERRRLEYRNEYPVLSQREADPGTADADLFEQGEEKETQENSHILVNPIQDESAVLAANMGAFVHASRSDILIPSHKLIVPEMTSDVSISMKKTNVVLVNAEAYFAKQDLRVGALKKDTPHYVPTYLLSPATLLFHKTLALVFAFMLTFGTYTALHPQYALHAEQSIHEELASISGSYQKLATSIAPTQVVAASSLSSATLLGSVSGTLSSLAQGFSSSVDRFIYAIMFPSGATDSVARVDPVSGTVSINIAPYQGANQPAPAKAAQPISVAAKPKIAPTAPVRAPLTSPQPSQSAPAGMAAQTIVNNNTYPVIERIVERQALASAGGLTEAILNDRLNQLDNKLTAQMLSLTNANSTAIAQNYNVTAQSNAIHNLANVTISNPTITGGSISGTSVAATSLSISGINSAILATDANGLVSATTSIGTNYLTGTLGTINGTTFARGDSITVASASSTLLIDNNTFSGANIFSSPLSLSSTSGTTTIATGQGFTIGSSQFVLQQGSGRVGIGTTSPRADLHVGGGGQIMVQNGNTLQDRGGDFWMTANAYFDGTDWRRQDASKTAFGLDLRGNSNLPNEAEQGAALWIAQPGTNPISSTFGTTGGWEIGWAVTATRNLVIGGMGLELDGNGLSPYGRLVHNNSLSTVNTGIAQNIYADFSGRDASAQQSWFAGFVDDAFKIRRLAGNDAITSNNFSSLLSVNASGTLAVTGNVGIGTTSPLAALSIVGSGNSGINIGGFFGSGYGAISLNGTVDGTNYNLLSGNSVTDNSLYLNRASGGAIHFREANGTDQMTILTGGNVGIGTTTPYSKLTTWGTGSLFEAVTNSSSTVFSIGQNGATTTSFAISNLASALLSTNANGSVVATTSIGVNYLSGILGIANGGTATGTQVTNGINYFDGTRITSNNLFTYDGTTTVLTANSANTSGNPKAFTVGGTVSTGSTGDYAGIAVNPVYTASSGNTLGTLYGLQSNPRNTGSGTISGLYSIYSIPQNTSNGIVTSMTGILLQPQNTDAGTTTSMQGVNSQPLNNGTGTTTTMYGLLSQPRASAGSVTTMYGAYLDCGASGASATVTTCYTLRLGTPVLTGTISTVYGLYQDYVSAINYFGGKVGIGTTTPSKPLTVYSNTLGNSAVFRGNNSTGAAAVALGAAYSAGSVQAYTDADAVTPANLVLQVSGGNVGIGTTSPFSKLTTWGTGSLFEAVTNSSSTVFSIGQNGATTTSFAITNLTNSLLSTNANGSVVATTSIGMNYLTGILGIANGGTATSTQVTNGINYFDGSRITSNNLFTYDGTTTSMTANSMNTSANVVGFTIGGTQSTSNTGGYYGLNINPLYNAPTGNTLAVLYGMQTNPRNTGSGTITSLRGIYSIPQNNGSGEVTSLTGILAYPQNTSTGTTTTMVGLHSLPSNTSTGTTTVMYGLLAQPRASAGSVNTMYGAYLDCGASGASATVDLCYQLRLATPVTTGTLTDIWGLYQDYAGAINYFGGPVSLGDNTVGSTYGRPSMLWIATSSVATTQSPLAFRSARAAIVSGNMLGGMDFYSDDTNLTAPGTRVAAIQALANTTHTAAALGTDLTFSSTNGTTYAELMRLTGGGNLGIGTTTPTSLLEVGNSTAGSNRIYLTNSDSGVSSYGEIAARNGYTATEAMRLLAMGTGWTTVGAFVQDAGVVDADASLSGGLSLAALATGSNMRFYTNGHNERMRIDSSGNVGIGTTSPAADLSIAGNGYFTGGVGAGVLNTTAGTLALNGSAASSNTGYAIFGGTKWRMQQSSGDEGNAGVFDYGNFDTNALSIVGKGTSSSNRGVRIYDALGIGYSPNSSAGALLVNGNVGIGEASPLAVLSVGNADSFTNNASTSILFDTTALGSGTDSFRWSSEFRGLASANDTRLLIGQHRTASGSDWTTGAWRIQPAVDNSFTGMSSNRGYLEFAYGSAGSYSGIGLSGAGNTTPDVVLSSSGFLGISTTTPGALIDLGIGVTPAKLLLYNTGNNQYGFGINSGELSVFAGTSGNINFRTGGSAGTSNMYLESSGEVGIGNEAPLSVLSVTGPSAGSSAAAAGIGGIAQFTTGTGLNTDNKIMIGFDDTNNYGWLQSVDPGTLNRTFAINPNGGNVGIGTTSPSQLFSIAGNGYFTGQMFGNLNDTVSAPSFSWLGDATTGMYRPATSQVALSLGGVQKALFTSTGHTFDIDSTAGSGTTNAFQVTGTQSVANTGIYRTYSNLTYSAGAGNTLGALYGFQSQPQNTAGGTVTSLYGVYSVPQNTSSGIVSNMYGVLAQPQNTSTGTTTLMVGVSSIPNNTSTGTTTTMYGILAQPRASNGSITTQYGAYLDCGASGASASITTCYELRLGTPAVVGSVGTVYGLYQDYASAINYFGGNVGIGSTSPMASLSILGTGNSGVNIGDYFGSGYGAISLNGTADGTNYHFLAGNTVTDNTLYINRTSGGAIQFREAGGSTPQMTIATGGNVGIGTSTPQNVLSVAGASNFMGGTLGIGNLTGGEGGQMVLGWNGAFPTGQVNRTWNMDIDSSDALRLFSVNASGASNVAFSIASSTGLVTIPDGATIGSNTTLTNATTTALAITSLAGKLLSTNANGSVVATTSIGTNYLTGILGIANGGTATSTQVTNGVNYFDGTRITSGTALTFDGTNLGVGTNAPLGLLGVGTQTSMANNASSSVIASTGSLGTALDNFNWVSEYRTTTSNVNRLLIGAHRTAAGVSWTTSAWRIQPAVDNSFTGVSGNRGYLEFALDTAGAYRGLGLSGAGNTTPDFVVSSLGRVGIGTTTPTGLLEVGNSTAGANRLYITNANSGTGSFAGIEIRNDYHANNDSLRLLTMGTGWTSTGIFQQDAGVLIASGNLSGGLSIGAAASAPIRFYTGGTADANERLRIDSSGNVGIGNSLPLSVLSVTGPSAAASTAAAAGTGAIAQFTTGTGLNTDNKIMLGFDDTNNYGWLQSVDPGASYRALALNPVGGNVSIGTTTPYSKLTTWGTANLFEAVNSASTSVFLIGQNGATSTSFFATTASSTNLFSQTAALGALTATTANFSGQLDLSGGVIGAAPTYQLDFGSYYDSGGNPSISHINLFGGTYGFGVSAGQLNTISAGSQAFFVNSSLASPAMYINTSGNVGIGTTTPWAKLSVNQFNGGSAPMFVVASSTGSGATSTAFIIDKNGSVGVGTTSPWRSFSVVGTVAFNGLTTGSSVGNAICLTAAKDVIDSGTTACTSSSLRFKENIETLPQHFALDTLDQLRVVSFDYKEGYYSPEDRARSYGLIAEEVQQIDPALVDFGYDGLAQSLKFEKLTGLTIQGIQELNLNLETIASTTASSTPQSRSFATSFFDNVFSRLTTWFADTANGIGKFFAKEVHTDTLCVSDSSGETCITKVQLDALLAGAASAQGAPASQGGGSSGGGGGSTPAPAEEPTPAPDTEAPTITINGNNPATIEVGSTYADLGASVTDNVDNNLGIKASVDGGAEIELGTITIDTSAAGTHTIKYKATDNAGNVGTATRTVVVQDPATTPPAEEPAPETTPTDTTTPSTDTSTSAPSTTDTSTSSSTDTTATDTSSGTTTTTTT